MSKPKIVISYRFTRPDTTGVHCQSALYNILGQENVTFIDPDQFDTIFDIPKADLFLAIDDDGGWGFPKDWKCPVTAAWFIDTHVNPEKRINRCSLFDHVYTAQLRGGKTISEHHDSVRWLPLAHNPDVHHKVDGEVNILDWCFVGNIPRGQWLPMDRAWLVDHLQKKLPNCYVGNAYGLDMMTIFCSSKFIFNRSIIDDLNMRVFEALASGRPLLTNWVEGQDRIFDKETFFIYGDKWCDPNEVAYLDTAVGMILNMTSEKELRAIGEKGRNMVLKHHTYEHRMREILYDVLSYGNTDGILQYDKEF